jgi:Rabenosyn Rab binding domain
MMYWRSEYERCQHPVPIVRTTEYRLLFCPGRMCSCRSTCSHYRCVPHAYQHSETSIPIFVSQSLPKPKKATSSPAPPEEASIIDPDSEVAHVLQPLLEQEALLESFVEEAKAHRKFEDAKTLTTNLKEIRSEIDKIMENVHSK